MKSSGKAASVGVIFIGICNDTSVEIYVNISFLTWSFTAIGIKLKVLRLFA